MTFYSQTLPILEELRATDFMSRPFEELRAVSKQLAQDWDRVKGEGTPVRLSVLAGFTTDYLTDMLRLMLMRRGLAAEITAAGYGQLIGEVLSRGASLSNDPDLVVILPSHRDLRYAPGLGCAPESADDAVCEEAAFWAKLVRQVSAPTVMLSFDQPAERLLGELEGFAPGGLGRHARMTNMALFDQLPRLASLVDAEALQARLGPLWHDPYLYTLCKQPFAMRALPEVADTLAAQVAATMGKSRKVLVLDLDNTLWGGVVGDVGGENLELGPETPEGEAFVHFQRFAQGLAHRGIVLALCSKNNQDIALSCFRSHPSMVLKEEDIAAFVINFDDKATNIRKIAETLNVGLDALVFADDNPVERAWVHRQLPDVTVIDLPENPALYAQAVVAAKPFPMVRLTREDVGRTASYKAIALAKTACEAADDIDTFLKDLQPEAVVEAVDEQSMDRIAQLIAKTNQFKIGPQQFSLEELRRGAGGVLAVRLTDRLQDYGIVAVAVTEVDDDTLRVKNWVMSCRVFGRRLEHVVRQLLGEMAAAAGAQHIVLNYVSSAKNGLVPAALASVGFSEKGEGTNVYVATAATPPSLPPHHMTITDKRESDLCRLSRETTPMRPSREYFEGSLAIPLS
jgi:FkbH-like protein